MKRTLPPSAQTSNPSYTQTDLRSRNQLTHLRIRPYEVQILLGTCATHIRQTRLLLQIRWQTFTL
jgi:hypothetical protein